jgi:hypothetical protein
MAQEVKDSTIATGSDMPELMENLSVARELGWITSGPIVADGRHLTQTLIKLGPFRSS